MDKHRKKQIKKYVIYVVIALVVLVLAVMPLIASQNMAEEGPQASILTATAERRTIHTQLIGGGLLTSSATEEITIPKEIKLTEYLVGNGDIVKAGDPIARVDKVSVLTALANVQETLDYLAGKISDAGNSSNADEVNAHAGGLVKILYGRQGDSVRDVMLQHGALAVLSLDGRMAVDIDRSTDLKAGSTVCVYMPDGTEVDGKVESAAGSVLTVSIEDSGYAVDEPVTVKTDDGRYLGSGALYIHNAWNAAAYYGTISRVRVSEGNTVSAGKTLFDLEISDYSAQFQILTAQRQEYEQLMQELFRMYDSGVISAPCDGIVTGVDDSGSFLLSDAEEQTGQVQLLSHTAQNTQPAYSVVLLSNYTTYKRPGFRPGGFPGHGETDDDETDDGETGDDETGDDSTPDVTYTVQVGQVINVDGTVALHPTPYENITDLSTVSTDVNIGGGQVTWDLSNLVQMDLVTPYTEPVALGDVVFYVTASSGNTYYALAKAASGDDSGDTPSEDAGTGDTPQQGQAGTGGAMGGGSRGGSSAVPAFEPYSLETLTIASATSQEEMSLEITVDEQDIAKMYTGQEAVITVEALTGQSFPAVVTSVSNSGTNEGGSSKFTAKLALRKTGDILPGMHASAFLTLNTAENTLSIPVAALAEKDGQTIVYTAYSEKDEVLEKPVAVTTGVSDGEYVQILSGLSEGDAVCYAYYDTLEFSNTPEGVRF